MFCLADILPGEREENVELLAGAPIHRSHGFVQEIEMDAKLVVDFACTRYGTVYVTRDEPQDLSLIPNVKDATVVAHFYKQVNSD